MLLTTKCNDLQTVPLPSEMQTLNLSTDKLSRWPRSSSVWRRQHPCFSKRISNFTLTLTFNIYFNLHLWMTHRTEFTDSDFWKCSWACAGISMTDSWLFLSSAAWGPGRGIRYWLNSPKRKEISPNSQNFFDEIFKNFYNFTLMNIILNLFHNLQMF